MCYFFLQVNKKKYEKGKKREKEGDRMIINRK